MKEDQFKIYIDRLKEGRKEKIEVEVDPAFLTLADNEVLFNKPVKLTGEAYLAENHLLLNLKIIAEATMPCSICNEPTQVPIAIKDFKQQIDLEEFAKPVYDFADDVRTAILLKIPPFAECGGNCPDRKTVSKFLKQPAKDEGANFPFQSLE